jgi:hypothetical protein
MRISQARMGLARWMALGLACDGARTATVPAYRSFLVVAYLAHHQTNAQLIGGHLLLDARAPGMLVADPATLLERGDGWTLHTETRLQLPNPQTCLPSSRQPRSWSVRTCAMMSRRPTTRARVRSSLRSSRCCGAP